MKGPLYSFLLIAHQPSRSRTLCNPSIGMNETTLFAHLHIQEVHHSLRVFFLSFLSYFFSPLNLLFCFSPTFLLLLSISCFVGFLSTFATHSHSHSNRTSLLSILAYCVFSFAVIGFDEIYSVWAATPPYLGKHQQLQDRYMW